MFIGDEETTSTEATLGVSDAGTVTGEGESSGAPAQDTQEAETTSQEPQGGEEGQAGASPDSLPANERIQQLIAKDQEREQKIAALEGKLTQIEKQTVRPDFLELDFESVNAHFKATTDQIDELRLAGNILGAMELQDELNQLRDEVRANENRKKGFIERQQQGQQQEQVNAQLNQRIGEAAELVRKDANITEEVWKAGEKFFAEERQKKPLLDAQYRESIMMHGPIAGLLFAKDYVMKEMGGAQKDALQKKEAGKAAVPGGKTVSAGNVPAVDLKALHAKAAASGDEDDMLAYMAAKREAQQKQQT